MSTSRADPKLHRLARLVAATSAIVAATLIAVASPAAAHVYVDGAVANPDGTTTFTISFDHGCALSPTIELHTSLPDTAEVEDTTQPDGWSATVEDGTVRWTGPPIPAGDIASFTVTTTRFGHAGDTVLFPTVQTCEEGEHSWISTDPDASEPAPLVVLDAQTARHPTPPVEEPQEGATGSTGGATSAQVAVVIFVGAVVAAACGASAGSRRPTSSPPATDGT